MARQPYGLHLQEPAELTDPINRVYQPTPMPARWKDVECETQNELLLVTLALHTFRLARGHYPAALAELAPAYLRKLPDDPYAVQGGFKYRLQGKRYILYSVGPDGKDDGGKPINDLKVVSDKNPLAGRRVRFDSVGDVVAGFNYF